jgi:hypothetical protein
MGRLGRTRLTIALVATALVGGCSALTSFSDFTGGAPNDAASGSAADASSVDGATNDAGDASLAKDTGSPVEAGSTGLGPLWLASGTSTGTVTVRTWSSTSNAWSAPLAGPVIAGGGAVHWIVARETKYGSMLAIALTPPAAAFPNLYVYERHADGTWTLGFMVALTNTAWRAFDMEVLSQSGDVIVAYADDSNTPQYRVRLAAGWGVKSGIGTAAPSYVQWIELASNPVADEISMLFVDIVNTMLAATYVDGAWSSGGQLETQLNAQGFKAFDLAYENGTGNAVAVWGRDTHVSDPDAGPGVTPFSKKGNGSAIWSTSSVLLDNIPAGPVVLRTEPGTNRIALSLLEYDCNRTDAGCDSYIAGVWSGSAWGSVAVLDSDTTTVYGYRRGTAPTGIAWLGSGNAIGSYHSDLADGGSLAYTELTGTAFGPVAGAITSPPLPPRASMQLVSAPGPSVLALVQDINGQLWCKAFANGTWHDVDNGTPLDKGLLGIDAVPFGASAP